MKFVEERILRVYIEDSIIPREVAACIIVLPPSFCISMKRLMRASNLGRRTH